MGGNIFVKDHKVLRLEKAEYNNYCKNISDLFVLYGISIFHIVSSIEEKESFGDMDIVVSNTDKNNIKQLLAFIKLHYPYSSNGNVFSFLYFNFQIDLIFVNPTEYSYACNYFNWNDMGNLLGRTAKQVGFKHGWQGLYYVQRYKDRVLKEHLLSTSYLDILTVLKITDKHTFKQGFKTFDQMFKFVSSSPFFHSDIFKLENLNHTNKVRDRKRKTYQKFLAYSKSIENQYTARTKLTEEEKLEYVCSFFPSLRKEVELVLAIEEEKEKVKEKYNGFIVSNITNLSGKELGKFMSYFSQKYSFQTLSTISSEDIVDIIHSEFEIYNENHTH